MAEKDKSGETAADPTVRGKLSDADFAAARELYELGEASIVDLSEKYAITRQALSKRLRDVKSVKGSRSHEVAAATKKSVIAAAAAPIERFTDKQSDWIEETRITGYQSLKQANMIGRKLVLDAMKSGAKLETIDSDLRALGRFNKVLVDNIAATLRLLKADDHMDEEDLPTLTIEDLTDDEILQHHISTGAFPEDMTLEEMMEEERGPGGRNG